MALAIFQRAARAALAKLGEGSLLQGSDCGKVTLQKNVLVDAGIGDNANDNPTVYRDLAVFDAEVVVRIGDVLSHPDGAYKVDALLERTQYLQTFIVVRV